jgi:hypothetical protein
MIQSDCRLMAFALASRGSRRVFVTLRYVFIAFTVLVVTILVISPLAGTFVEQWSRHDVELRSRLVFNSMRDELAGLLAVGAAAPINNLFDRLTSDESLLAAGFCDHDGVLRYQSKLMPADFSCEKVARTASASFSTIESGGRNIVVSSFPVATRKAGGHLILLNDLTYAARRSAQARTWIIIALTAVALIGATLASAFALLIVRRWLQLMRRAIEDVKAGRDRAAGEDGSVFGRQFRDALQELADAMRSIDVTRVDWTPETLHLML